MCRVTATVGVPDIFRISPKRRISFVSPELEKSMAISLGEVIAA